MVINKHKQLIMTALELISSYRQSKGDEFLPRLLPKFAFKPVENQEGDFEDVNLTFRTEIMDALLYDFTKTDHSLIKELFTEEVKCANETWVDSVNLNLKQLCFYLYTIGDLEDVFDLYAAKYQTRNFDVACMLDRDMVTLGYDVDMVIEFVKNKFKCDIILKKNYSKILWVLDDIKVNVYHTEGYTKFVNQYFLGPKTD